MQRTAAETVEIIDKQFKTAYTATNFDTLTSYQRETGIKDSIAQPFLDQIIKQRQCLQKAGHEMPYISKVLEDRFEKLNPR